LKHERRKELRVRLFGSHGWKCGTLVIVLRMGENHNRIVPISNGEGFSLPPFSSKVLKLSYTFLGGIEMKSKYDIEVKLTGQDGNVFNLISIVSRALRENVSREEADVFFKEVTTQAKDYDHALRIMMDWVKVR